MKVKATVKKGFKPSSRQIRTGDQIYPYFVKCISPQQSDVKAHMMIYLEMMKKVSDTLSVADFKRELGFDKKHKRFRKGDPTRYSFDDRLDQAYHRVKSEKDLTTGTIANYNDCVSEFYSEIDPSEIVIAKVELTDGKTKTTFNQLFD